MAGLVLPVIAGERGSIHDSTERLQPSVQNGGVHLREGRWIFRHLALNGVYHLPESTDRLHQFIPIGDNIRLLLGVDLGRALEISFIARNASCQVLDLY